MSKVQPDPEEPQLGTVKIMTDEPIDLPEDTMFDEVLDEISEHINRRPWIVPAAIGGLVLLVWLTRRGDD